jgi:(1->4)-alpha-D-glucan 1-alpha-D-glucosylmutase
MVDYLQELGVSDCYASPLFQAGPQSTHGYDICRFDQFNPNLGGSGAFQRFAARLQQLGLGLLLDMVPNHMGADLSNGWWLDVLEKGQASPYANWFDIDWQSPNPALRGKVLLPILDAPYARVLEAGQLKVVFENERFALAYHERQFPLTLPKLHAALAQSIPAINGIPGNPESFDELHALVQQQHYRLAFWRIGAEEINYRRFFDIAELVSLRMELPEVFKATHRLVLQLIREGKIRGLRIDHPDGLWDPTTYFERLQTACAETPERAQQSFYVVAEKILTGDETLSPDWPVAGTTGYDFLNRVNALFVNSANRDAMDRIYREFTGEQRDFKSILYSSKRHVLFTSFTSELNTLVGMLKTIAAGPRYGLDLTSAILRDALVEVLVRFPVYRCYIDEQMVEVAAVQREFIAAAILSTQKQATNVDSGALQFISSLLQLNVPRDLDQTGQKLARRFVMRFQQLTGPLMAKGLEDTAFYNFNRLISLNEVGGDPERFGIEPDQLHTYNVANAQHWPHTLLATATHDTKRGEDARARINVLAEIPQEWREAVFRWQWLNADKKSPFGQRGVPEANDEYLLYQTLVGAWSPDLDTAAQLQSFKERIAAYMLKATREAKTHTSWTYPDSTYEQATRHFVEQLLSISAPNPFLDDFKQFHTRIAFFGCFNSLAQLLIKMTAPGVPDFYQGTELWDLNLVDPDNRRPVDFQLRRDLLVDIKKRLASRPLDVSAALKGILQELDSGKIKLYLIWRTLAFRQEHRRLFDQGVYVPLSALGSKRGHAFAFARVLDSQIVISIVPRLVVGLSRGIEQPPVGQELWQDTYITAAALNDAQRPGSNGVLAHFKPGKRYRNVLTGEIVEIGRAQQGLRVADALASFPVALLEFLP